MSRIDIVTTTAHLASASDSIEIHGAQARHLARARRIRPGERAIIKDGKGLAFEAQAISIRPDRVVFSLTSEIECRDDTIPLILIPAVIKGKRMDWLIQKACELGTREIMPVITDRTVTRTESGSRKVKRWEEIALQALQQCSGNRLTRIHPPCPLDELLDNMSNIFKIMLYEGERSTLFSRLLASECSDGKDMELAVLTGPEGGLTTEEADMCRAHGFRSASLGSRILRTETACLAAAAIIKSWRQTCA